MPAQDHARHPSAFRRTEHRPQISRIGDPIHDQEKRCSPFLTSGQSVELDLGKLGCARHDPLVRAGRSLGRQPLSTDGPNRHTELPSKLTDVVDDVCSVEIVGHENLPDLSPTRQKELTNRLTTFDLIAAEPTSRSAATRSRLTTALISAPLATATLSAAPLGTAALSTAALTATAFAA